MNQPQRVQRKRIKGFKLPKNTVCVNRGTKWGNPFMVEVEKVNSKQELAKIGIFDPMAIEIHARESAINKFEYNIRANESLFQQASLELKGKNLACFCPLDKPCHADVLLKIANEL